MKVKYDKEVDVMKIIFSNNTIAESDEEKPGVFLDYNGNGNVLAMEILDA